MKSAVSSSASLSPFPLSSTTDKFTNLCKSNSLYVYDAVNKRKSNVITAPFWGFNINEHKPQLGDLVCRWRENPITSMDSLPSGGFKSHCDIVVEIRDSEVRTLGGNVNQSVSITAYPLNSDGFLRPASNVYGVLRNNF